MNYKTLLKKKYIHKGVKGIISASQLDSFLSCGMYQSRPAGEAALKGTVLHYCIEHNIIPDGIPKSELKKLKWLLNEIEVLKGEGWIIIDTETYIELPYLTGSFDMLMQREGIHLCVDHKTGTWPVQDNDNFQMGAYVHLIFESLKTHIDTIHTLILQPAKGYTRIMDDWPRKRANSLKGRIAEVDKTKRRPSLTGCKWCGDMKCEQRV